MARWAAFCENTGMHIHILGICGTFMGSLAVLAKQLGYQVSGSDQNVYPPMSTQLERQGISLCSGYEPAHLQSLAPDLVVIGNTCSRGNPAVEHVLERGLDYCSGPQWLADHVLKGRWVLAVAGTHGKTTTSSMLTWILEHAGLQPGYLIGGVPLNFETSARLGESPFFVIEADEYDSAFFDKRSKFIHYRPRTAILGNLEFDHADIFADLAAIQTQFQHLLRTIPRNGLVIVPARDENLAQVLKKGVWSEVAGFAFPGEDDEAPWQVEVLNEASSAFRIRWREQTGEVHWGLNGRHNVQNAGAAVAAAAHAGVPVTHSSEALSGFAGVKRRLELIGEIKGIQVYDDFAHHPTAIRTTLEGLRARRREQGAEGRLIAVVEARSNTMKMGYHQNTLAHSLAPADQVVWYNNGASRLDLGAIARDSAVDFHSFGAVEEILDFLGKGVAAGDSIVIMSNGGFEGLHQRLCQSLET